MYFIQEEWGGILSGTYQDHTSLSLWKIFFSPSCMITKSFPKIQTPGSFPTQNVTPMVGCQVTTTLTFPRHTIIYGVWPSRQPYERHSFISHYKGKGKEATSPKAQRAESMVDFFFNGNKSLPSLYAHRLAIWLCCSPFKRCSLFLSTLWSWTWPCDMLCPVGH